MVKRSQLLSVFGSFFFFLQVRNQHLYVDFSLPRYHVFHFFQRVPVVLHEAEVQLVVSPQVVVTEGYQKKSDTLFSSTLTVSLQEGHGYLNSKWSSGDDCMNSSIFAN